MAADRPGAMTAGKLVCDGDGVLRICTWLFMGWYARFMSKYGRKIEKVAGLGTLREGLSYRLVPLQEFGGVQLWPTNPNLAGLEFSI